MKRFLIFVSAHLVLFLLVIAYQAQADHEEWNINRFEKELGVLKEAISSKNKDKIKELMQSATEKRGKIK